MGDLKILQQHISLTWLARKLKFGIASRIIIVFIYLKLQVAHGHGHYIQILYAKLCVVYKSKMKYF